MAKKDEKRFDFLSHCTLSSPGLKKRNRDEEKDTEACEVKELEKYSILFDAHHTSLCSFLLQIYTANGIGRAFNLGAELLFHLYESEKFLNSSPFANCDDFSKNPLEVTGNDTYPSFLKRDMPPGVFNLTFSPSIGDLLDEISSMAGYKGRNESIKHLIRLIYFVYEQSKSNQPIYYTSLVGKRRKEVRISNDEYSYLSSSIN